ncbi:MAG: HDIG domain-containing protein [Ignavibacteriales bacterium]|nr:Ribonuclease Y [Ignavibacteriaceae bacterium]QOJ27378.1 MAG: HDIG domain-containing protein [Ignavibacteriales bacterium]
MSSMIVRTSLRLKIILVVAVTILIALLFPREIALNTEVSVGSVWIQDDLISEGDFPVLKDAAQYRRELEAAKQSIFPVFRKEEAVSRKTADTLRTYLQNFTRLLDSLARKPASEITNETFFSSDVFNWMLQNRANELRRKKRTSIVQDIFSTASLTAASIYRRGILNTERDQISKDSVAIRAGNIDIIERKDRLIPPSRISAAVNEWLNPEISDSLHRESIRQILRHFLKPNLIYDAGLTREEVEIAQSKVSRYSGIVTLNERIVAKHDRITPEIKLKIDSYSIYKGEVSGLTGRVLQFTGKLLHIFSLLFLFGLYLYKFRNDLYQNNKNILLFGIMFLWLSFVTYLVNLISVTDAMKLLIFIPAGSMLLTIIYDSRVGFYSTVIAALISGALRGNDYSFVLMNVAAGAMAAYSVRDIKNRTQIFRSFLSILGGYAITILAFGFERYSSWDYILLELAFAGTSALISPVLTYGLLIFFERLFKITTELTLVELQSFDHPLLRQLSASAPGTFNHSLNVANLAEEAALAIKANGLLAKTGAYYHDIGKSLTPEYFIENQRTGANYHDTISPEESVQLLLNHVKKGIQLAEEYGLPEEIIKFIPAHHGTSVLTFFYEKAKGIYGEEKVNISDYRYPGPKPSTKETAILMLADTCESAARSLTHPDQESIEKMVDKLIKQKKEDGQLDDSPITFRDLMIIRDVFIERLQSLYHRRVAYPDPIQGEKAQDGKGIVPPSAP